MVSWSHSDAQNEEVAAVVTVAVESVSSSFSTVVVARLVDYYPSTDPMQGPIVHQSAGRI